MAHTHKLLFEHQSLHGEHQPAQNRAEGNIGHYKVSSTQLIWSRERNNHGSLLLRYSGQDGKKGGGQYLADTMNGSLWRKIKLIEYNKYIPIIAPKCHK